MDKTTATIAMILWILALALVFGVAYKTHAHTVTITAEVPATLENSRSYGGIPTSVTVLLVN